MLSLKMLMQVELYKILLLLQVHLQRHFHQGPSLLEMMESSELYQQILIPQLEEHILLAVADLRLQV